MLHVHVSMLHVHAVSPCCMSMLLSKLHVLAECILCISMHKGGLCFCFPLDVFISPCLHVSGIPQTDNGTNGKRQLLFFLRERETANLRLFAANGNGEQTLVFLGRQTINGNRRLLLQQMCPSKHKIDHKIDKTDP